MVKIYLEISDKNQGMITKTIRMVNYNKDTENMRANVDFEDGTYMTFDIDDIMSLSKYEHGLLHGFLETLKNMREK